MMQEMAGIATYRDKDKSMVLPNGSRIKFGYCDNDADLLQYQGAEYDVIFIDEATQLPEEWYTRLTASVRGANDYPKRMYITCNPGGVGHGWVKRLFIDRQFAGRENPDDYVFIPARVYDNKALVEQDTGYVAMLEALPEDLRRAWLDGDWDVFAGQYFAEWRRDIHVISPFNIPKDWRRYVSIDYGLDMLAALWIAVDWEGKAYVYREYCEGDDLGEGHHGLITTDAIRAIKDRTAEEIYSYIAPPDLWGRKTDTGKSTAAKFAEDGIPLVRAQNSRVMGWLDLREWLKPHEDKDGATTANLVVFDTCATLIRSMPALVYDDKDPNDCAIHPHAITHAPDALRYFVAGRPRANKRGKPQPRQPFDFLTPKPRADGCGEKVRVI